LKHLPDESFKNINLILNNADHDLLEKNTINILWIQHFVNQKEVQNLGSKEYLDKLDYIVFNSNWNFEKFVYQFKVPESKSLVIRNAVEKIPFIEKPKDKISLIYHTTPWRGLANLLNIFCKLDLEKVELNVCSSTKIYGKKLEKTLENNYNDLFKKCKNTKNVNYLGFVENKKIIELLQKTHIYAFPSIWPETSCISAIESLAAGCEVVTTNLGALYETCTPFGTLVGFDKNLNNLEKKYEEVLLDSIKNFWSSENQTRLKLQRDTINSTYSWDVRSIEWKKFFDKARRLKN
jgi:glycosyltransferase involved in cell wall biosynthesis